MSASSNTHALRTELNCRNCGTPAPGKFCPECGQDTAPHPPSVGEFIHEFIGHYVAFEGKLWRTLMLLFFKPGQLTREYLAGRKQRYVLPLRLYLTISLLFFFLLAVLPNKSVQVGASEEARKEAKRGREAARQEVLIGNDDKDVSIMGVKIDAQGKFHCNLPEWACVRIKPKLERLKATPEETMKQGFGSFKDKWPYAMFLLMPIFALLLKLVYLNRGMVYGEHIVFSLHVHAAWFVLVLLMVVLPDTLALFVTLALPVYTVIAMRQVYAGRWWASLLRAAAIAVPYVMATLVVIVLLVALIALT